MYAYIQTRISTHSNAHARLSCERSTTKTCIHADNIRYTKELTFETVAPEKPSECWSTSVRAIDSASEEIEKVDI